MSKHAPSRRGRNKKKLALVRGSTATYSHSHSQRSPKTHGGRTPCGHQRRLSQVLSPNRAPSTAKTRAGSWAAKAFPKSFFQSFLRRRLDLAVATTSTLGLDAVPLADAANTTEARVSTICPCCCKYCWTSLRRALCPAAIRVSRAATAAAGTCSRRPPRGEQVQSAASPPR
jgi:hypothetical protein